MPENKDPASSPQLGTTLKGHLTFRASFKNIKIKQQCSVNVDSFDREIIPLFNFDFLDFVPQAVFLCPDFLAFCNVSFLK